MFERFTSFLLAKVSIEMTRGPEQQSTTIELFGYIRVSQRQTNLKLQSY